MGEQKALVSIVYFKDLKGATEQYASFFTSQITISISARLSQNDAHKSDFYQPMQRYFRKITWRLANQITEIRLGF